MIEPISKYIKATLLFLIFHISVIGISYGQNVYSTPSGSKYHLYSCRMVDNVSKKHTLEEAISEYGLTPCKICHPPAMPQGIANFGKADKSVGSCTSVQCIGMTQKGLRCKHKTRLCNGYCYQHNPLSPPSNSVSKTVQSNSSSSISSTCGALTKSGSRCKRKVSGGGRCYQHS